MTTHVRSYMYVTVTKWNRNINFYCAFPFFLYELIDWKITIAECSTFCQYAVFKSEQHDINEMHLIVVMKIYRIKHDILPVNIIPGCNI